jgi:hypothetical protein
MEQILYSDIDVCTAIVLKKEQPHILQFRIKHSSASSAV